jgi:hypothetical protein
MFEKIRKWYEGKDKVYTVEPGASVVFFSISREFHWTARLAHLVVDFYLREWKWLFTAAMTFAGLLIAYSKLR